MNIQKRRSKGRKKMSDDTEVMRLAGSVILSSEFIAFFPSLYSLVGSTTVY